MNNAMRDMTIDHTVIFYLFSILFSIFEMHFRFFKKNFWTKYTFIQSTWVKPTIICGLYMHRNSQTNRTSRDFPLRKNNAWLEIENIWALLLKCITFSFKRLRLLAIWATVGLMKVAVQQHPKYHWLSISMVEADSVLRQYQLSI